MKNWYFKVNIDFTIFNGGIVATTESVQVKNSGIDGKGFKNLSAAKDWFLQMVESTSKRDDREDVSFNIKNNKNFIIEYFDKCNEEFVHKEYIVTK